MEKRNLINSDDKITPANNMKGRKEKKEKIRKKKEQD